MNRFIAATYLNYKDELTWYPKYRGRLVRCIWRNRISRHPDLSDMMTFIMFELDEFHNIKTVLSTFSIYMKDKDNADPTIPGTY